jgi:hypothetical protein
VLRPIVTKHPKYLEDKFRFLVFKLSRIWQHVHQHFGPRRWQQQGREDSQLNDDADGGGCAFGAATPGAMWYDWYVRLWDDNYFLEENFHHVSWMLRPQQQPVMIGKIGWRYMSDTAIFPFAGGGAGWFLSGKGLDQVGPSIPEAEKWFVTFRARKDIFLPHEMHDEDVFLTAWFHLVNVSFVNVPGVEHVSPGMSHKQRCLSDATLLQLRWNDSAVIFFDYPAKKPPKFSLDGQWYAFGKPIVWHYMSPTRLLRLESLLYPERSVMLQQQASKRSEAGALPPVVKTGADVMSLRKKCYPGVPDGPLPPAGKSMYETRRPPPDEAVLVVQPSISAKRRPTGEGE